MLRLLLVVLLGLAVSETKGAEGERPEFKPVTHLAPLPPVTDPPRKPASEATMDLVRDSELVLGVIINGQSRAYPLNMISRPVREVLNDTLGGEAIAATFCSLCNNGVVYRRKIEKQIHTFAVQGSVWNKSMVMYDVETRTQWSQYLGEGMEGKLKGHKLEVIPTFITDWASWRSAHPETTVLAFSRTGQEFITEFHQRPRRLLIGLATPTGTRGYPFDILKQRPLINDLIGSQTVLVTFDHKSAAAAMFSRQLETRILSFEAVDDRRIRDLETKSIWDAQLGHCLTGELAGKKLPPLPAMVSLGVSWLMFHPQTTLYGSD